MFKAQIKRKNRIMVSNILSSKIRFVRLGLSLQEKRTEL